MADASLVKKDVPLKLSSLSRGAEQQQLDVGGMRIGKQRLVGKKKKHTPLKKLILEEREDKQLESGSAPVHADGNNAVEAASSTLTVDVDEFLPTFCTPAAAVSPQVAQEPSSSSSQPKIEAGNNKRRSGSKGPGHLPAYAFSADAPEFVPSWSAAAKTAEAAPAAADEGELPVGQAMERLRALKEKESAGKEKKVTNKADNIEVRHYVHQVLSSELDEKVKGMLGQLAQYQERAREKDPLKFSKLKRLCYGMREAERAIGRGKAKCLILAPNLEECSVEGGLDDVVETLIEECRENDVPVVFALSRNRIGKALGKSIRLSIVCVLSAEGAHQGLKEIIKLTEDLRRQWVMRRMSVKVTDEEAAEEQRLAEERAAARAARKAQKQKEEEEKKVEEERKRAEAKAAKEAQKAERQAAREKAAEEKRLKREREHTAREAKEKLTPEQEKAAEEERAKAAREVERQRAQAKRDAEQKAEEERRKLQELIKKRAEEAKAQAAEEGDESSDEDLPLGFSSALF
mmetsp:Transcript_18098/g.41963  ORF Transcript_18098/g.41963 Transcript_18098/m.41963 type:complete len:518 (+) Transcript_18098:108-1661(+)